MNTGAQPLDKELTFTRFDRMSEVYPDRPAVMYLGELFSYRRLRELSERFAGALLDDAVPGSFAQQRLRQLHGKIMLAQAGAPLQQQRVRQLLELARQRRPQGARARGNARAPRKN